MLDLEVPDPREPDRVWDVADQRPAAPPGSGGARAALFHGVREQSYIYHAMVEAFGWRD